MPKKKTLLPLGEDFRKCQPKLRMIANGSSKVNTLRAEQSASIAVTDSKCKLLDIELQRGDDAAPV
ncbi:MAG TPA: hypothetical protein VEX60_09320, partial [Pyrinomonadaceae bacterium]|nr:hypothetical protein [Pyrinomonadaceae bacterium]